VRDVNEMAGEPIRLENVTIIDSRDDALFGDVEDEMVKGRKMRVS